MDELMGATSVDDLLNIDLEAIGDLPLYLGEVNPCFCKFEITAIDKKMAEKNKDYPNGRPYISVQYKLLEVVEMKDPNAEPPKAEGVVGENFWLHKDPSESIKYFKARFAEIAPLQGWKTVNDIIDGGKGLICVANLSSRADKDDSSVHYAQIRNLKLA